MNTVASFTFNYYYLKPLLNQTLTKRVYFATVSVSVAIKTKIDWL